MRHVKEFLVDDRNVIAHAARKSRRSGGKGSECPTGREAGTQDSVGALVVKKGRDISVCRRWSRPGTAHRACAGYATPATGAAGAAQRSSGTAAASAPSPCQYCGHCQHEREDSFSQLHHILHTQNPGNACEPRVKLRSTRKPTAKRTYSSAAIGMHSRMLGSY